MTILELIQQKKNTIETVKEAYNQAIASQKTLNAIVTFVEPKLETNEKGLLFGIPIAIKDNVSTANIKTTASSKILENYVPVFDATIVKKLKAAGASLIAKTSMDELAMGGTGLTAATGYVYNPYDQSRIAGGSSAGSAALVAAGIVPLAIGSDTGDSVRKPASFCGIVGVKPTYGKISRYGVIPYASSLDHVGYFTRSVEDACIALQVLQGRDDLDMTSSNDPMQAYLSCLNHDLKGKKILVFKNVMDSISNNVIKQRFNDLVQMMKDQGAIVTIASFDDVLLKAILPTYYIIANCEASANHSNLDGIRFGKQVEGDRLEAIMINSRTAGLGANIRERFVIGSYGLFEENQEKVLRKAQKVRRLIVEMLHDQLKDADVIIAPASGKVAPTIKDNGNAELSDEYLIAENYMVMGNFSGYPSLTLPMGYDEGLPFGMNITANPFAEQVLFDVAAGIELLTGLKDAKVEQ